MKHRIIGAALAAALAVGSGTGAQAVSLAPAAGAGAALLTAAQTAAGALPTASAPPAQTVQTLSLTGVEREIREKNPTLLALRRQADGIGAGLSGVSGGSASGDAIDWSGALDSLKAAYAQAEKDGNQSLVTTYGSMIEVFEALIQGQQASMQALLGQLGQAQAAYDEAEYAMRKAVDYTEQVLCSSAGSALIGIQSLACAETDLQRNLAALDRQLAVMQVQLDRGMISPLDLENARTSRSRLAASLSTLNTQRESIGSTVALLCGRGADTRIEPNGLPAVSDSDLKKMDYDRDLESAQSGSYTIWQKQNAVRQAANSRDNNQSGTTEQYEAALRELEAAKEDAALSFRSVYDAVGEKQRAKKAAEQAVIAAQADLEVSRVKYQTGALSRLEYQSAQDALAAAQNAVEAAKLNLLSAYQTYTWAVNGLIPSAGQGGAS